MKINWKKIFNPNNIDYKALKKMNREEVDAYMKEIYVAEWAKIWCLYTWLFNYLCVTNTWQYAIVLWTARF
jgi:hypothetical protein